MKSDFIPSGKVSGDNELKDYADILSNEYFQNVLNSLPFIVAILNSKRQIVFSNNVLIKSFDLHSIGIFLA